MFIPDFSLFIEKDKFDADLQLELDENDDYQKFKEFFLDVYPEFEKSGRIVRFLVCSNQEAHLRGNVYVQYDSEFEASNAYQKFHARW